jgi:hypothetical protein
MVIIWCGASASRYIIIACLLGCVTENMNSFVPGLYVGPGVTPKPLSPRSQAIHVENPRGATSMFHLCINFLHAVEFSSRCSEHVQDHSMLAVVLYSVTPQHSSRVRNPASLKLRIAAYRIIGCTRSVISIIHLCIVPLCCYSEIIRIRP